MLLKLQARDAAGSNDRVQMANDDQVPRLKKKNQNPAPQWLLHACELRNTSCARMSCKKYPRYGDISSQHIWLSRMHVYIKDTLSALRLIENTSHTTWLLVVGRVSSQAAAAALQGPFRGLDVAPQPPSLPHGCAPKLWGPCTGDRYVLGPFKGA